MASQDTRGARRRLTAARIERAALSQAVENGSTAVTVESICDEALISARTFYNYFPTRDAVLAGEPWPTISAEAVDRFTSENTGDLLSRLVRLFIESGPQSPLDREITELRRRLFEREAEWADQAMAGFSACVGDIAELVLAQLEAQGRSVEVEPDLPDVARMIVMMTGSVLHASMLDPEPGDDLSTAPERLSELARRAIACLSG